MNDKELSPDYIMRMEKQKLYKERNKEKIKAYQAEWRKNNPIDKEKKSIINKLHYEKSIKKRNNKSLCSN